MWCKNDRCCHYNKEENKCTRIGTRGEEGICWMARSEREYQE